MADVEIRWSFRRVDVLLAALFVFATMLSSAAAWWIPTLGTSRRFATLGFTFWCIAAGAAFGTVLAVAVLVRGQRVEPADPRTDAGRMVPEPSAIGAAPTS